MPYLFSSAKIYNNAAWEGGCVYMLYFRGITLLLHGLVMHGVTYLAVKVSFQQRTRPHTAKTAVAAASHDQLQRFFNNSAVQLVLLRGTRASTVQVLGVALALHNNAAVMPTTQP
jgi:hypothetical protein